MSVVAKTEINIGRQRWSVNVFEPTGELMAIRMERVGTDFRGYGCGPDGEPELSHRIGRKKIRLKLALDVGRIVACDDKNVKSHQLARIAEIAIEALREAEGHGEKFCGFTLEGRDG